MIFETHSVGAPLDSLVESVFHYRHFKPDHSIERVVPTGHLFILFELDGFERHTYDNASLQPNASFTRAWLSGIQHNYISISAHDDSEMFVIQFRPWGAYPFLHTPLEQYADRVVPGADILGGDLLTLHGQLLDAPTSEAKFACAEAWLAERYDAALAVPASVIELAQALQAAPGATLKDLIETQNGASQKHLISQFRRYVGMTPKQYQRILRFNAVFAQMQGDQFLRWSDIAQLCGYSDQSHFIREFRHFSGFSPTGFVREEFDDEATNFFPLDREG